MDMLWSGWGDPARAKPLPDTVIGLLRDMLGVKPRPNAPVALGEVTVPEPRLEPAARRALAAALDGSDEGTGSGADGGEGHVRTDPETRIRHTRGKSTPDLLRIRDGDVTDVPEAVLYPASHDQVLAVLRACAEHGLASRFRSAAAASARRRTARARPAAARFVALDCGAWTRPVTVDAAAPAPHRAASPRRPGRGRLEIVLIAAAPRRLFSSLMNDLRPVPTSTGPGADPARQGDPYPCRPGRPLRADGEVEAVLPVTLRPPRSAPGAPLTGPGGLRVDPETCGSSHAPDVPDPSGVSGATCPATGAAGPRGSTLRQAVRPTCRGRTAAPG
ncbi:hypothetical protein SHIRM173S_08465 [Streptomyces hirsutus]